MCICYSLMVLQGRTVSFKNTLVILTSNIGSRVISATGASRGMFSGQRMGAAAEEDELMSEYEQVGHTATLHNNSRHASHQHASLCMTRQHP